MEAASPSGQLIPSLTAAIFDVHHIPGGSPYFGESNVNRCKLNQPFSEEIGMADFSE